MRRTSNSRVVLIPAACLASCKIEEQLGMTLRDGQIVIKPVRRPLREGWCAGLGEVAPDELAQGQAQAQDWLALAGADDTEWVW